MGTVKYTGPVASFHCPTNADIRSLKVHFSPKQLGEGTPSPDNVREIEGWDGVESYRCGKNLLNPKDNPIWESSTYIVNDDNTVTVKSSDGRGWTSTQMKPFPLKKGTYTFSWKGSPRVQFATSENNYTDTTSYSKFNFTFTLSEDGFIKWKHTGSSTDYPLTVTVQIERGSTVTPYEPYHGSTTNYEFGVLGKNKFNWDVPVFESSPVSSNAATARKFTLDTYVIGMSVNNYYRQNYANWVLSPSVENGVISFSSGAASGYGIAFPLKLAAGQTYFLSGTGNGVVGATYYNEDGELISYQNGRLNKTITVPDNAATTLIGFYANASNTDFTFSNIQLELGSTATTYEPYNPNHTVYGGWVDLISGEVCEKWKIITINSTRNAYVSSGSYRGINCTDALFDAGTDNWGYSASYGNNLTEKDTQCETFNLFSKAIWGNPDLYPWCYVLNSSNQIHCVFDNATVGITSDDTNADAITKIKAWVNEHPIKVAYCVSESKATSYSLAPTQLQTFLGQNNVWSNADYVEVEYDLHETQDILARKQFIMASQPHVEEASGAIATFTTDMAAKLKECKVGFKPVQDLHGYSKPWVGGAGKNLFNINSVEQDPDNISYSNENKRIFTPNTYFSGSSYSNYWYPQKVSSYSIQQNSITIDSNGGYGVGFAVAVTEGNYYLSWVLSGEGYANVTLYKTDGTAVIITNGGSNPSFTIPNDVNIIVITFRNKTSGTPATFSNIQLEKGSSATAYEPWENVCPITGWNGATVNLASKNIASKSFQVIGKGTSYGGAYGSKGSFSNDARHGFIVFPVPPGSTITVSCKNYDKYWVYRGIAIKLDSLSVENNRYIGYRNYVWYYSVERRLTTQTIQIPNDADGLLIEFLHVDKETPMTQELIDELEFTCVIGTEDVPIYEPYRGTTLPIDWSTEAGTVYGGYVDLVTGEVWKTWREANLGDLNWRIFENVFYNYPNKDSVNGTADKKPGITNVMCPSYATEGESLKYQWSVNEGRISGWNSPTTRYLYIKDSRYSDPDEFKVAMNGVYVYYELENPVLLTTFTPIQLKSLRGINNIYSNTNDNIIVKFWKH